MPTCLSRVFLPTLLWCSSRFLLALQQNRVQSRLLYLSTKDLLPTTQYKDLVVNDAIKRSSRQLCRCKQHSSQIIEILIVVKLASYQTHIERTM